MYLLVTAFTCAVFLVSLTKLIWSMLNNFLKYYQKPFTLEKQIKLLHIKVDLQKIYSDWIADSNCIIHQNLTYIWINFNMSSVNAICINLKIWYPVMNPSKLTLVWTYYSFLLTVINALPRCNLILFEWYRCPNKSTQTMMLHLSSQKHNYLQVIRVSL